MHDMPLPLFADCPLLRYATPNFIRKNKRIDYRNIFNALVEQIDQRELAIFWFVGWALVPCTETIYNLVRSIRYNILDENRNASNESARGKFLKILTSWKHNDDNKAEEHARDDDLVEEEDVKSVKKEQTRKSFARSATFQVVDHFSQASKIALSVIVVDGLAFVGNMIGYAEGVMSKMPSIYSRVVYTGWFTTRLQALKRNMLKSVSGRTKKLGKLVVFDRLIDGLMYFAWGLSILDYLEVETGVALKSLFSVGATGTLVLGLASKELASEFMNGIHLNLSDKMYENDSVRLSDGTSGVVENMGWLETMIRSSDDVVVGIPNSQLSSKIVYNLSQTPTCQVKQALRIDYADADKMTKLLETIKIEIKAACPKLITDGSRAFNAHWRGYADDHLEVVVDCHFKIKPTGGEYWNNRQRVLEAIYRAVKKTGVHFVIAKSD